MFFYLEPVISPKKIACLAIVQFLFSCVNCESGWLKVCNPEQLSLYHNYEVEAENCPNGVWLPEASSLGCICVNGLWVLTNDWCDENYQFIYGQGHCFNLENQVRKISYVGNAINAFETQDYIANSQAHVFHALNGSKALSNDITFFKRGITVLRINPQKDLKLKWVSQQNSFESDSVCLKAFGKLDGPEDESTKSLTILTIQNPVANVEIEEECTGSSESSEYISKNVIELKPGKLISVRSGKIVDSSEQCESTCNGFNSHERVRRGSRSRKHKGLGRAMPKTKAPKKQKILIDLQDPPSTNPNKGKGKSNCSEMEVKFTENLLTDEEKMLLVDEETRRALKIEINLLMSGQKGPNFADSTTAKRHWGFLQHMKKVFLTLCPSTQVPPFIINSVMRLFRYISIHTRDGNPYGIHFEDSAQDSRIVQALDKCALDRQPFEFYYVPVKHDDDCRNVTRNKIVQHPINGSVSAYNTTEPENVKLCLCTNELTEVNFTIPVNSSLNATYNLNKTVILLPEKQQQMIFLKNSTLGKHDFITETIWKIINFGHFYCAKYFVEHPQDHSALFDKLESLFNKDIIFRWNHPKNNSMALWKFFYSAYDVEKFVMSLDACLAGAKVASEYPKWLTRPTKQSRAKRELENPALWDGNGLCMRDQWGPLDRFGLQVPQECREGRDLLR